MSLPSIAFKTLQRTISNISSHTLRSIFRSPVFDPEPASGISAAEGANQISSNFSGPSNGDEVDVSSLLVIVAV